MPQILRPTAGKLAALLAMFVSMPCAASSAAEIALRSAATIDGTVVRLGDVAEVQVADSRQQQELEDIELLPSPVAGREQKLTMRELQELLSPHEAQFGRLSLSGASAVTIAAKKPVAAPRPMQPAPTRAAMRNTVEEVTTRVNEVLAAFVRTRLGDDAWQVQAKLSDAQVKRLGDGNPARVLGARQAGDDVVQFRLEVGEGDARETLTVAAQVALPPMIVVARRAINRGEMIGEGDVELVRKSPEMSSRAPFESLEDVVGKESLRAIAAGQPIDEKCVRPTLLVKRGQVVTVYSRCGNVQIRTNGRAKEDGSLGQFVSIEVLGTRESFQASVAGPQEVEIETACTTTPAVDDAPRPLTPWLASRRESNVVRQPLDIRTTRTPQR